LPVLVLQRELGQYARGRQNGRDNRPRCRFAQTERKPGANGKQQDEDTKNICLGHFFLSFNFRWVNQGPDSTGTGSSALGLQQIIEVKAVNDTHDIAC
jgi:hypothetical protein